jgi:hypothetical protein
VRTLALAIAAAMFPSAFPACNQPAQPPATTAAEQADVLAYGAEQSQCVALSATSGEARDCVTAVRQRWCGPGGTLANDGACGDGGAMDPVVAAMMIRDGGADR